MFIVCALATYNQMADIHPNLSFGEDYFYE